MLAYLILVHADGEPIDPELIARFEQADPPDVPFRVDQRVVWRNHNSSRVFFGWQAFAEVAGIGSHWLVDDRQVTAFSGHCWPATTGWVHGTGRSWAAQLREWLETRQDVPVFREALFGHFTLISLQGDGGWIVPDFASVDQLFTAQGARVTAISNRAGLCARAVSPAAATPERSLTGAGWLVSDGWMFDEETGYWDVQRPRTGSYIAITGSDGARIVEPLRPPFLRPDPAEPAVPYEVLLDEVDRDLRSTLRVIAELPLDDRVLGLSGGKDSRTLAAIILSEGLQDRFRFVTNGSPERADVIAARQLALQFGLDWEMHDASERTAQEEESDTRSYVALREGMNSTWSSYEEPVFSTGATVSGVLGEALRWGPVSMTGVGATTEDELVERIQRQRPVDRLGIMLPEARRYYRQVQGDIIREMAAYGEPFGTVSTVYYHEGLVRGRNGPDYAWSPQMRISPFISPICMRASHRLAASARPDNRFHLDLQRRCNVLLSKLPFADSAWAESSYAHLPDANDYRAIRPTFSTSPDGRTWRVKRYADYRPMLERYLLDQDNPLMELLDIGRVTTSLETGAVHPGRTRLLWSALSAAIWMGGHEVRVEFTRPA
ncbi:MAG: hypothetical protein R2855_00380 [Thermomicrobiales bacterium]